MERICDCCHSKMTSGYCIHDGEEYYCSDDCLHSTYSEDEYEELCSIDEAYWTVWDEDIPTDVVSRDLYNLLKDENLELKKHIEYLTDINRQLMDAMGDDGK